MKIELGQVWVGRMSRSRRMVIEKVPNGYILEDEKGFQSFWEDNILRKVCTLEEWK